MNIFPKEDFYGNIEYKRYFYLKNHYRFQKYTTQLNYRLYEGNGKAIYIIGVEDDGTIVGLTKDSRRENIEFFKKMCLELGVTIKLIINGNYNQKDFLIILVKSDKHQDNF